MRKLITDILKVLAFVVMPFGLFIVLHSKVYVEKSRTTGYDTYPTPYNVPNQSQTILLDSPNLIPWLSLNTVAFTSLKCESPWNKSSLYLSNTINNNQYENATIP